MKNLTNRTKLTGGSAIILAIIAATMALEGGHVNHPNDPGGETNRGITKQVARENGYFGPMKALPDEVAISIYYDDYIVAPGFAPLVAYNAPIVAELFDTGVNMGPRWPSLWFQQTINEVCNTRLVEDGKVGAMTRKAFTDCQATYGAVKMCLTFLDKLDARQEARYDYLVRVNPRLKVFRKGWQNHRIGNVKRSTCQVRHAA